MSREELVATEFRKRFAEEYFRNPAKGGLIALQGLMPENDNPNINSLRAKLCNLRKDPIVRQRLRELHDELKDELIMSKKERAIWLSELIRTPFNMITEDSPYCQRVEENDTPFGKSKRVMAVSKLDALKELNKMDASYDEGKEQVATKVTFGSLLEGMKTVTLVATKEERPIKKARGKVKGSSTVDTATVETLEDGTVVLEGFGYNKPTPKEEDGLIEANQEIEEGLTETD
jgi:hypothetical protein